MPVPDQIRRWYEEWLELGSPRQQPVEWQRELWIERCPALADHFRALPRQLDREVVRNLVLGYPLDPDGAFLGLVDVFTWGWSQTRRGLTIARPVMAAGPSTVGPKVLAIRAALEDGGPVAGYSALMGAHKVRGLGQAFGTKLLHFLSPFSDRALIVDSVMAKAFRDAGLYRIPAAQCSVTRYRRYLQDMRAWASELSEPEAGRVLHAEDLEALIFGFNVPEGSPWAFVR